MRNQSLWNEVLNKVKLFSLVFVTTVTMTACSFNFKEYVGEDYTPLPKSDSSVVNQLSSLVDATDFKDEDSVQNFFDALEDIDTFTYEDKEDTSNNIVREFENAVLVRVVDGDTIVVNINNEECKVRLIGINTPESVASKEYLDATGKENTEEGKEASEWLKEYLSNTEKVFLQKDISDTDKYDRKLRYVWLEIPNDERDINEIQTKMLNGILLDKGIAEVAIYKPDTMYADEFQAIYTHTTDDYEIDR